MSTTWKIITVRKDPGDLFYTEYAVPLVDSSTGVTDAFSIPRLGTDGKLDASLISGGTGGGEVFQVSSQPQMLALAASAGDLAVRSDISTTFVLKQEPASDIANWIQILAPSTVVSDFAGITSGTNTQADMIVGNSATLSAIGNGIIDATEVNGHVIKDDGNPNILGKVPIGQPDGSAIYADPIVSGPDAPGTAPTENPVQIAGWDGTLIRRVLTTSTGVVKVDGSDVTQPVSGTFWQATQPVSGTVTAIQAVGSNLHVQVDSAPVTAVTGTFWQATQPVSGPLTDAELRATPVPVSGTFWQATQPVSGTVTANAGTGTFTVSGSVTATQGGAPWSQNITQIGGSAVTLGSKTSANSFPVVIASDQAAFAVTGTVSIAANSSINLNQVGGSSVSLGSKTSANSVPVVIASDQGTVTVSGSGTFTVAGTVTANAGSGTFTTSDVNAQTQGSATSGQKGFLHLGGVTTAAPSYTTGQSSPLSLTTTGLLRIDGSGVTQPVSGTVGITANSSINLNQVGGSAVTLGSKTSANSIPVVISSDQGAVAISGTVTANAGTGTFTTSDTNLVAQASTTSGQKGPLVQGAVTTAAPTYTTAQTSPLSLTTAGLLRVDGSGVTQPVSGTVTSNQGTAAVTANAWPIKLTDGTNVATIASLTNSKALAVEIVDGSGTQITTFGGGTQYSDGTTQATPTGTISLGKNPSNILHAVSLDASGNLNVNVAAGGASGGTSSSFGSAFPATGTAIGASDGTNMQSLLVESSSNKNLRTALYNGANEAVVSAAGALKVDGSAVTQPVSQGTAAATTAGWPVIAGTVVAGTAAWTSGTAQNTALTVAVTGYNLVTFSLNATSTMTGGVLTFEASDDAGATYYPVQAVRSSGNVLETTFTLAVTSLAWTVNVAGFTNFRIRLSTAITGTGTATLRAQATASVSDPEVTIQGAVSQSGTWTVQQGGAPWSQNLTQVAGTTLGATAVTNFGTAPAAAAVSGVNASLFAGTTGITATGSSLNANITNTVPVTLTSTTITGTVAVTQSTSPWTVAGAAASGAAKSGNPVQMGGVFNTTQPTVTTGQAVEAQSTARGAQIVATGVDTFNVTVNAALPSGTNVIGHVITDTGSTTAVTGTVTVSGTVTANIGTTNGIALDASVTGLQVSQGSTTSGQKGGLTLGAVTTAAPTYTTAQTSPLSLTTTGGLRVDGSGVTQPVSGTVAATQSGTWTVQPGNTANSTAWLVTGTGGTFPVTGTVTANIGTTGGITVAQASTTSGQSGPLVQGAVTTAAPTYTTAQTSPLSLTTAGLLRVDGSGVTQPVSGTVTANIGTSGSLALDASVTGLQVTQGSATSGQKGGLVLGAVTTNAPAYTTAQTSPVSLDTAGLLRVSVKDTPSNTNNLNVNIAASAATVTVSGTVTANQGGAPWSMAGNVASGAADSGNPVKVGGVFNTTQPTVTTGQRVDLQATARGGLIVATGTDTFNVTVNAALPTGTNTIGSVKITDGTTTAAVIAGTTALKTDLSSVAGTATVTAAAGVQKVGVVGGSGTSLETTAGVLDYNLKNINNAAISVAASGVQKVGVVGNAGATVDSTVAVGTAPTNAVVTGVVFNSTAPAPTNGQAMAVQADQAGNLRVMGGMALSTLAVWNSGTSINTTQNIFTNSGAASVLVQLVDSAGTFTTGAVTFEVTFDGTNWITISADAVLDPTSATLAQISLPYTLLTSTNKPFLLLPKGAQGLRIKLSTAISGTGTTTPNYALLPYAPVGEVIALSPTAANFNVTVGGSLPTGTNTLGSVKITDGTTIAAVIAGTTALKTDLSSVAGTATSTAASGVQKVGIVGNTGAAVDAAGQNAASPANSILIAGQFNTSPTTITTGNVSPLQLTAAGNLKHDITTIAGTAPTTAGKVDVKGVDGDVFVRQTTAANLNATVAQGSAAVTASAWPIKVTDGTNTVTVANLTNSKALAVEIVDGSGTQITSFGGGTQYADGTTQVTPTGTVSLGKNPSNVLHAVSLDASGNLNVNVAAGGASGGTSSSFGAAFPATGTAIGASDGTNMQSLLVESSSNKNLRVALYNGANEAAVSAGGALTVDGSAVTQPVSGTVTANQGGAPWSVGGNVASGAADSGNPVKIGGVFNTTQPTVTNAQRVDIQMTARGGQIVATGTDTFNVTVNAALPTGTNTIGSVKITDGTTVAAVIAGTTALKTDLSSVAGTATVTAGVSGVQAVGGNVANGGTATANPVPVGGVFTTSPTTLTTGQTATLQFTAAQNLKHDITTIAGTAPTTVGKLDVKGADGDVFVRQTTAANLNATVVQGTAAALASAWPIKITDGTDLALVTANGSVQVEGYSPAVQTFSTITTTGAQSSITTTGLNIATITLRTFTGTTPIVTWKLQASDDNTNWVDLQGINNSTGAVGISWTQNGALTAGTAGPSIDYTIGAYSNIRINITAISGTSATAAFGVGLQTMPYEASPGAIIQGTDGTNLHVVRTDNVGSQVVQGNTPTVVQKTNNVSTGSVASLAKAFVSNNTAGNTIIVVFANGNNNNAASPVTDTLGNTYTKATQVANSTTFETSIFYATNIAAGANTVTVTPGGANASIAMEIYEISGLLSLVTAQPGKTATNTGTSATASTTAISASIPNSFAISGVAIGTAAQTITPATGWTNDSGQQNPVTPAGLFSFISMSQYMSDLDPVTPQATFTSEPWAIAAATFRPYILAVEGTVKLQSSLGVALDGATAATVPANALLTGVRATTAFPTALTDGQMAGAMADKAGRQVVVTNTPRDLVGTAILSNNSSSTTVSFISAGAAGVFNDLITLVITNRSATATVVSLSDNGAAGNIYTFALAGNGGVVINFPTPLPQGTAAAAWQVLNSAAVACDFMAVFAKNK